MELELHGFSGDVPIVESVATPGPLMPYPESTSRVCSLGAIGARAMSSDLAALALFVASAALFRRALRGSGR